MNLWISKHTLVDNLCVSHSYQQHSDITNTYCGNVENYVHNIHNSYTGICQNSAEKPDLSTTRQMYSSSSTKLDMIVKRQGGMTYGHKNGVQRRGH